MQSQMRPKAQDSRNSGLADHLMLGPVVAERSSRLYIQCTIIPQLRTSWQFGSLSASQVSWFWQNDPKATQSPPRNRQKAQSKKKSASASCAARGASICLATECQGCGWLLWMDKVRKSHHCSETIERVVYISTNIMDSTSWFHFVARTEFRPSRLELPNSIVPRQTLAHSRNTITTPIQLILG